jgi:hypothetical protein
MSLFDFFFPEQAQASHLRRMADQGYRSRRESARARRESSRLESRVDELEDDLGYVTLVLGGLLQALDEKGTLARKDVRAAISELDSLDGVPDGKLDINILKGRHS